MTNDTTTLSTRRRRPDRRVTIAALLAGALVLFGAAALSVAEHVQYRQRVEAQTVSDVGETRAKLESALANRLSLVDGVGAFAVARHGDVAPEFEQFALGLAGTHRSYTGKTGSDPALRSLQLAPEAVVTHVWPLEGNEEAIGHDLLADPVRGPAVRRAIADRRFVLAGPFELIQGGMGLVGRNPVYLAPSGGEPEFWGFATVVINFDVIAAEAGLTTAADRGLAYAVRGRDGLGAVGDVFVGDGSVFDNDPIILDVLVPNGTWQVAAHPIDGWPVIHRRLVPIAVLVGGLAVAIALSIAVWRNERARRDIERISDDLFRIVHSTASPIMAIDADGTISEWNNVAARVTGIGRAEAVGTGFAVGAWRDLCSEDDADALLDAVSQALAGRITNDVRITLQTDPPVILDFDVTPRGGGESGVAGAVCIAQDMTARIEAERVRAENLAMARSARLKDEFLAGMSHELRTPLNAVIGLSQVLKRGTFGALNLRQQSYVEQIGESGNHLLALINDVLDLAKIEASATRLEPELLDLSTVVRESMSVIEPMARNKRQTIDGPHVSGDTQVVADVRRMRQVLLNLLSNAVKFTPEGGSIGTDVLGTDSTVEISVWDTGIGIPQDQLHLLFEPFQQLDGSLAREHEGTGLGLAMVAKLVELHGGTVDVDSRPGEGSRFTVRFPRQTLHEAEPVAPTTGTAVHI